MARTILLTMAVLLIAAPASALLSGPAVPASLPTASIAASSMAPTAAASNAALAPQPNAALAAASNAGSSVIEGLPQAVDHSRAILESATRCEAAVRVESRWFEGRVSDRRQRQEEFLDHHAVTFLTTRQVPVYALATQAVEAAQALGAVLPSSDAVAGVHLPSGVATPPADPVQVLAGFTTETVEEERVVPVAFHATWDEAYVEWTPRSATVDLDLVAGWAHLASGTGSLVEACGGTVPALPEPQGLVCVCADRPEDGWRPTLLELRARLATPDDASLPWKDAELAYSLQAVEEALAQLGRPVAEGTPLEAPAAQGPEGAGSRLEGGASARTPRPRGPEVFGAVMAGVASLAALANAYASMRRR